MKKNNHKLVPQPAKFELKIRLSTYFDGEHRSEFLARIMFLCAANIYSMGEEGIHPKHEIEDGAVIFETDDPEAAKKFGFTTRTKAQLAQLAYIPTPAERAKAKLLLARLEARIEALARK